MKLIRTNVFETNSSSTHSLSVDWNADYTSITPESDGMINVWSYDFGWDRETFSEPMYKLSYVMIYLRDWTRHLSDDIRSEYETKLTEMVCEHTGAIGIAMTSPEGYIDHQSVECHDLDYLFQDMAEMKAFIFGRNSYLETGNDNS